eukprot:scaffold3443_cov404-Prasinococcus_capsulatus_cf.AAC.13
MLRCSLVAKLQRSSMQFVHSVILGVGVLLTLPHLLRVRGHRAPLWRSCWLAHLSTARWAYSSPGHSLGREYALDARAGCGSSCELRGSLHGLQGACSMPSNLPPWTSSSSGRTAAICPSAESGRMTWPRSQRCLRRRPARRKTVCGLSAVTFKGNGDPGRGAERRVRGGARADGAAALVAVLIRQVCSSLRVQGLRVDAGNAKQIVLRVLMPEYDMSLDHQVQLALMAIQDMCRRRQRPLFPARWTLGPLPGAHGGYTLGFSAEQNAPGVTTSRLGMPGGSRCVASLRQAGSHTVGPRYARDKVVLVAMGLVE